MQQCRYGIILIIKKYRPVVICHNINFNFVIISFSVDIIYCHIIINYDNLCWSFFVFVFLYCVGSDSFGSWISFCKGESNHCESEQLSAKILNIYKFTLLCAKSWFYRDGGRTATL